MPCALFNSSPCLRASVAIPIFHLPYVLPSSVSRKSFACHSYENCRGVYQQFPIWNPSSSRISSFDLRISSFMFRPSTFNFGLSTSNSLPAIPFLFSLLHTLLRVFALRRNSTLLLSNDSALFAQKQHIARYSPAFLPPCLHVSVAIPIVVSFHPVNILLNDIECRVLGSLIEKEITTPEYYPLSLNALVNACNQKSNREPVMTLDEVAVRQALHSLDGQSLVRSVSASDSRVTKY